MGTSMWQCTTSTSFEVMALAYISWCNSLNIVRKRKPKERVKSHAAPPLSSASACQGLDHWAHLSETKVFFPIQKAKVLHHLYTFILKTLQGHLEFLYIFFFGSQMTCLVGCINLDCTWAKEVKRLLAAVHIYTFMKIYILHNICICIRSTYTSPFDLLHFPQTSGKPKSRWELRYFSACWTHGVANKTNAIHLSLAKAEGQWKDGVYAYDTVDGQNPAPVDR